MADMFLDPIIEKLINAGLRYLKDQIAWQKRTKEELEKLKEILPQIQAVVHFASSQEQITDQNPALNKWLWQIRDAIDDADDVLDDLEYMELEKQVTKNMKLRRVRSIMKYMKKRLVKDAEEACSAKLYAKRRLTYLALRWNNTDLRNINLDEKVLDNLQPPNCLRDLSIWRYMGARPAIWMNNVNLISNLEKIELIFGSEWETLPPFGQLPFLKSLSLWNMPKVKWLQSKYNGNDKYRTFPLLEELNISFLGALEDWFEAGVAAEDGCFFPCLIQLKIEDVPMLRELPNLPPSLKSLIIWGCHPELYERYRKDGGYDRHKIAHIPDIRIEP